MNIETVMNGHRDINGNEIFKYVYNKDTVRRVFNDLFSEGLRINNNDVLGKTIIVAYNHNHAQMIVDVFNEDEFFRYQLSERSYCIKERGSLSYPLRGTQEQTGSRKPFCLLRFRTFKSIF